ncbi:MAG: hypothetical protein EBX50_15165 [Chitinophagia bacterium]|nr:hypothetical protein [Chitinophagia bacterium]
MPHANLVLEGTTPSIPFEGLTTNWDPLQIDVLIGLITGIGFTRITNVKLDPPPPQLPTPPVGIILYNNVCKRQCIQSLYLYLVQI